MALLGLMSLQILVTRPGLNAIDDIIVDAGKKFSSLKEELDVPDNSNFSLEMQAEKARDYWLGLDELRNVLIFAQSDNLIPGHVRRGCSVNLEFVDGSVRRLYLSGY